VLSFGGDVRYTAAMAGARERARVELTAEILRLARRQVAIGGADSLSLRAVARELGMVSSAVYRYFPSRDELLTQLIIESYDRLGAVVEAADASVATADFRARWEATAQAMRSWAVAFPSEWALLFGTPVPGYRAPQDTIGPATRYTAVLMGLLVDLEAAGARYEQAVPAAMAADLEVLRTNFSIDCSVGALAAGMQSWAALMGAISLELFGHLHKVVGTPGALFAAVIDFHGDLLMAAVRDARPALAGTGTRRRTSKRP